MDRGDRDSNFNERRRARRPLVATDGARPRTAGARPEHDWGWAALGHATEDLLVAFDLLAQRGTGSAAWAAPFRHDPIAFLLDTVSDAANLWAAEEGELLYRNRAAAALAMGRCDDKPVEQFSRGERWFERRCLRFASRGRTYILELIHEIPGERRPGPSAE